VYGEFTAGSSGLEAEFLFGAEPFGLNEYRNFLGGMGNEIPIAIGREMSNEKAS
jgi:hypothetical protein